METFRHCFFCRFLNENENNYTGGAFLEITQAIAARFFAFAFVLFFLVWIGLEMEVFARAGGGRTSGAPAPAPPGPTRNPRPSPPRPARRLSTAKNAFRPRPHDAEWVLAGISQNWVQ